MRIDDYRIAEGSRLKLDDHATDNTGDYTDKEAAKADLARNVEKLKKLQDVLYAADRYSLLIIFQAMDAAGKDGAIEHVMSGVNPQGCHVVSFKQPSDEELSHDFLWRCAKNLPERGKIGVFNRSHYEEVLVVRVHKEILQSQHLPDEIMNDKNIWEKRFEQIRNFEQHNWKFSMGDVRERALWDKYMHAYEDAISSTSTKNAAWYVIPADKKWFTRLAVSEVIVRTLELMDLKFPIVTEQHLRELSEAKKMLENEV
ncbi:MAG: polyphosphate kinase 2 family protein [Acidobacteria bacterium]|nr:polyphosphate kinase 2 family protein [Acidobacteriota bacterium]